MPAATRFALLLLLLAVFANSASAFGAGSLPDDSNFKEFVWRHGDISEVLRFLPSSFLTGVGFTQLQIRQIYFGNWLRDFSQVVDTACLENIPEPVLRAIVCVMGMLEFGFATDEFDVTRERLGCYTHVEHIDNPRGYDANAKEIDTRLRGPVDPEELEFDHETGMKNYIANSGKGWDTAADYIRTQLRECIDLGRKGKAGDQGAEKESFIHLGAALHTLEDFSAHSNFIELYLHEIGEEDVFLFVGDECRVSIPNSERKVAPLVTGTFGMLDIFHSLLGEADDMAILQSKGSLDQIQNKLGYSAAAFDQLFDAIKAAISALPDLSSKDNEDGSIMNQLEVLKRIFNQMTPESSSDEEGSNETSDKDDKDDKDDKNKDDKNKDDKNKDDKNKDDKNKDDKNKDDKNKDGKNKDGKNKDGKNKDGKNKDGKNKDDNKDDNDDDDSKPVDPALLWQALEPVLAFHDRVKKWLQEGSDNRGQGSSKNNTSKVGELTDEFVFQVVNVVVKSSVKELRATLRVAKARVDEEAASADSAAIYEPGSSASDPSHSDLSKDHFSNPLNRPAGLLATVTSNWATQQVIKCWDDSSVNAEDVITQVLTILHHPAFVEKKSDIQGYMQTVVGKWWNELPDDERTLLREKLTKEMVQEREHEDHHLVFKPKGRNGPGEFPGSRVAVAEPEPRKSFPSDWAFRKFASDCVYVFQTILSYLIAPAKFLGRKAQKAKDSAVGLFRRKRRQPA